MNSLPLVFKLVQYFSRERKCTTSGSLSIYSANYIFGTTKNPHVQEKSCGESSRGDAGFVAFRCFSLVSNIGSSIRIPVAFNGIVGFKTTQGRLSANGMNSAKEF